jgi:hypothetical protein
MWNSTLICFIVDRIYATKLILNAHLTCKGKKQIIEFKIYTAKIYYNLIMLPLQKHNTKFMVIFWFILHWSWSDFPSLKWSNLKSWITFGFNGIKIQESILLVGFWISYKSVDIFPTPILFSSDWAICED